MEAALFSVRLCPQDIRMFVIGHVLQAAYQEAALISFFFTLFKDQMIIN